MSSWPTPCANDDNKTPEAHLAMKKRMGERDGTNSNRTAITSLQVMCKALHGQAAPASSSSFGSRQGLWATPRAGLPSSRDQSNPKNGEVLQQQARQWATPRSGKTTGENPETWALRQAKGDVATMPLTAQVKMEDWPTVSSAGVTGGPTGLAGGSGNRAKMKRLMGGEMNSKLNSQWVCGLMGLNLGWVSPSCPASVIKNWPRFVTGWLQATIEQTSCDYSETALCRPAQSESSDFFLAS